MRFLSKNEQSEAVYELRSQIACLGESYRLPTRAVDTFENGGIEETFQVWKELAERWFLGCPLSQGELTSRWASISSLHVALDDSHLAGYCFGYSPEIVRFVTSPACKWPEAHLFRHAALSLREFSVVFQVAIARDATGKHLAERLTRKVQEELPQGVPQVLWVLLWPYNLGGFRVAESCGFRLARTFSASSTPFLWGELICREPKPL